jgi:hypothetical protein
MNTSKTKVITYQAPNGQTISLCDRHIRLGDERPEGWYLNGQGEEYCSVSHGLHYGFCDLCDAEEALDSQR